ncbi:uncharacterized protein BX664DRAFT_269264, partial [Halteromyces radiatus]|uniref:uncharacterized protein n=1 Tax=Halteromyces radiatus TaxID=101107 RepID=UPI0022205D50
RILLGLNDVTKHIERIIQKRKQRKDLTKPISEETNETNNTLTPVIFVCRRDIKPLHLCSHLLSMAALANIKLIQLPANAETLLAQALKLQRVCVLFLELNHTGTEESLRLAVNEAPWVEAPWLNQSNSTNAVPYKNTRIKVLKTTGSFVKKSKK